ncbi:MAG: hypothetical protein LAT80_10100, partial [Balneolaceae bacterium]|nr:hypothetical protein [Balneolaceae bacterium]
MKFVHSLINIKRSGRHRNLVFKIGSSEKTAISFNVIAQRIRKKSNDEVYSRDIGIDDLAGDA